MRRNICLGRLLLFGILMMFFASVPVSAAPCLCMEKTADSEYYLYLREYPEIRVFEDDGLDAFNYEGKGAIYKMLEGGGFDKELYDSDPSGSTSMTSSDSKVMSVDSVVWCAKPGDVKVTVRQGDKTKINKVHVYDVKLNPIYKTSTKAVLKTKGNLKGCTAVLKIGKKTYKKKITRKNQVLTYRIKKPAAGKKITVKILKGKKEIFNDKIYVLYQKKITIGMSKKRAEQTYEYMYNRFAPKKSGKKEIWKFGKVKVTLKNQKVIKVIRK